MNRITRFFKQGLKSLKRERFFAVVNILGLSLGMFCFIISSLYVKDELSHDKWHENSEKVYVPKIKFNAGGAGTVSMLPPFAASAAFVEEIPGVLDAVNISLSSAIKYQIQEEWFETKEFYHTQPSFFRIFDFSLKYGNEETALNEPSSLIISSELAQKHFGKANPVGELISLKEKGDYKITGVLAPIPSNSHLTFDMITSIDFNKTPYIGLDTNWQFGMGLDYLLLADGYSIEKLQEDVASVVSKHEEAADRAEQYDFQKFSDIYMSGSAFRSNDENTFGGNIKYIYIFSLIGGMLLLVACFNYINLTTARSFARAKDMAVRKVIGASRVRLIIQNMGETFFLSVLAMLIAVIAVEVTLPKINAILGKRLALDFSNNPETLLIFLGLLLVVMIASGIYPAVVSSTFNISALLKGTTPKSKTNLFRKGLVVLQFVICAGLLASAMIIRGQANHLINIDIGYNAKNILNIDVFESGFGGKYDELRTELGRIPQIEMISGSPLPSISSIMMIPVERDGEEIQEMLWMGGADKDFVELFGLEMVDGKSLNDLDDSELATAVLINEAAVKRLDLNNPIGHKLATGLVVQGVVKDFHFQSGKNKINPMLVNYDKSQVRYMHVKFKEGDRASVLAQMERVWESFETNKPFEVTEVEGFFLDAYAKEESLVNIFDLLTAMLVLVSFLGLFALTAFENQLREKELSIRKVLGASNAMLIKVMNQRFAVLIVIALLASIPITQYLIGEWLSDFPYRIANTAPYFMKTILSVGLITVVVLSVHGYKNARKNPVDVLRNE